MQVNIDAVQTNEEINESILLLRRDVGQEGGRDDIACGEGLSYGKVEYERLCVDVANVYAAFVSEEDGVAFTSRCNANVVFGVGGMGKEGLNDKVVERSGDRFDLIKTISIQGTTMQDRVHGKPITSSERASRKTRGICRQVRINACDMTDGRFEIRTRPYFLWFSSPLGDPGLRLVPRLVQGEQTRLSPPLDELVRLCYEFGGEDPRRELGVGSDGVRRGVPCDLSNFGCGVDKVCFDLGMGSDGRGALEPVCEEKFGVVFTDGCVIVSDEDMDEERRDYLWKT